MTAGTIGRFGPLPHPRPWRKGSVFGEGLREQISEVLKALWLHRLNELLRSHRITRFWRDIGRCLLRMLGADGRLDPTHLTIAEREACSDRTVRRGLAALFDAGMLTWQRRLTRVRGAWRANQTSNSYAILVPAEWKKPLPTPERVRLRTRHSHGGQLVRQDQTPHDSPLTPQTSLGFGDRVEALEALARRRRELEARAREEAALKRRPPG